MFQPRESNRKKADLGIDPDETLSNGKDADLERLQERHGELMGHMKQEMELQAEERFQMQVDDDYHHHLQWDPRDAQVLINRGQVPLVFNEGRLSVEWVCGTEKRNRIDYKVLPRGPEDEEPAEVATKVVKYTDDVNLVRFHRSAAFRQAVVSGLGWLEEGINIEPGEELVFAGSVDWRDVIRDSRSRNPDYNKDGRYLFRKRKLDLDYACALLPDAKEILKRGSTTSNLDDIESRWYLGERLTSAHDLDYSEAMPSTSFGDRAAYIGTGYADGGRRSAVDLIECWYKVPEYVEVFNRGELDGETFDKTNQQHVQAKEAGWPLLKTVRWRMRVMICTDQAPIWDGPSPFKHNRFNLVPVWGFRRGRDGMAYGLWRGMRDPQYDLNKRMSKALWAASSNRVIADDDAVEDIEEARQEIARPDGWVTKKAGKELREVQNTADVAQSLNLADRDREHLRNASGVTNENLGRDTNATSGKAIMAKQDQGSTTTAELFDNLRLATQIAGQLRLSNIQQFMSAPKVIRIVGRNRPVEWLKVNQYDPETGEYLNDITSAQLDFIVDEQNWRANMQQAALEQFMEMLKIVGPTSPQAVINLLDILVEQFDIPDKAEVVARIRQFNGQRDPSRKPTPEEEAAMKKQAEKAELQEQLQTEQVMAALAEIKAKVAKIEADSVNTLTTAFYQALQAGQIVAQVPGVAPVADQIVKGAGFKDQGGQDPNLQAPAEPMPVQPAAPVEVAPELQQADGAMQGIETPAPDGVM